jgi:hypothetical protein
MLLAGKNDERHSERNEVESRLQRSGPSPRGQAFNPAAPRKVISAGSFDFAQDDVAWKLVKLKHERVSLHSRGRAHGF